MKDKQEQGINVWAWIFAICDLVCIILAIANFDSENLLSICFVLLIAIFWDIIFFSIMFKDIKYLINKK